MPDKATAFADLICENTNQLVESDKNAVQYFKFISDKFKADRTYRLT